MNRYRKSAVQIMAKGDEIIAAKRQKKAIFRASACSAAGLCAAAVIAVGIWHSSAFGTPPDTEKFRSVTNPTTAVTEAVTSERYAVKTSPAPTSSAAASSVTVYTTAVHHTDIASSVTHAAVTARKTASASSPQTAAITAAVSSKVTRTAHVSTVTAAVQTSAITSAQTTMQTTHNWNAATDGREPCCHGEFRAFGGWYRMNAEHEISADNVGEKVGDVSISLSYRGGYRDRDESFTTAAEVFAVGGLDVGCAAAVRYDGCGEYYVYPNILYSPADLGSLIDGALRSGEFAITSAVYYHEQGYPDSVKYDFNDIGELLSRLEIYTDSASQDYNMLYPVSLTLSKMRFNIHSELLGLSGSIRLNEGGYVHVDVTGMPKSFNIGEEAVNSLLTDITQNCNIIEQEVSP